MASNSGRSCLSTPVSRIGSIGACFATKSPGARFRRATSLIERNQRPVTAQIFFMFVGWRRPMTAICATSPPPIGPDLTFTAHELKRDLPYRFSADRPAQCRSCPRYLPFSLAPRYTSVSMARSIRCSGSTPSYIPEALFAGRDLWQRRAADPATEGTATS